MCGDPCRRDRRDCVNSRQGRPAHFRAMDGDYPCRMLGSEYYLESTMTFVHPLLLSGLVLIGVPILVHLIMRQKPKHLQFPALRFLVQKYRLNQRKLQLRHLLLLLLRILLIAAICLALARPKVFSERLPFSSGQPVAAVLIIDTSPSMEYTLGGKTRLDEAKQRALELLDDLPEGSRVAILDTAVHFVDPGLLVSGQWLESL